jgi:Peptidase family M1 domain
MFSLCLLAFSLLFSAKAQAQNIGKIDGDVTINFDAETLSAKLKYDYVVTGEAEAVIKFYLNKAFDVKSVRCRLCRSFNFDRQAQPRPSLLIDLTEPLASGKRVTIEIEYGGSLNGIYNREHKFLELGLDNFWYPAHKNTSEFSFVYRVSVKTDQPNFVLVSNGRAKQNAGGWLVQSRVPDFDINLVLGDGLTVKTYKQGMYDLQLVSKNMPEEASATLLGGMKEILDFYNAGFGAIDRQREVTAVFRPFLEPQFGYFRKGYFVLPQTNNVRDLLFPIAHELSHYWWLKAGQQHAWLNESFAEYSAMLFLRKNQGVEAFLTRLEDKRKNSLNLPPVYGFDRTKNRQATPGVFYRKGVVKLSELEKELGEQKFMDFLRQVAKAKVSETDALIELLARVSSREIADRFLLNLKN